jgi:hypothetical protein
MTLRGVHGVATVLVAVATLLHLWTHAVATPEIDASPLDHVGCGVPDPGHDHDHDHDPHHHHDSMQHPDGFVISSADHEMAADSAAWYPVTPAICDAPLGARRLALGVPCRSPPYGHAARSRATRTLEVCRR